MPDRPSPPLPRRRRSSTVSAWSSAVCPVIAPVGSTPWRAARGACLEIGPGRDIDGVANELDPERGCDLGGLVGLRARLGSQSMVDVVGDDDETVADGEGDERRGVGAAGEGAGDRRSARRKRATREQVGRAAMTGGDSSQAAREVVRQSSISLARRPLG